MWFIAAALSQALTPLGCVPVPLAGANGENHVMFNGISPDGRLLALAWDRGSSGSVERGAYVLDLDSGNRTDLTGLNNAPSFSPDGRFLVSANYVSNRTLRTEIVEVDRQTGEVHSYASAPSGEWLASYSRDGEWILFNSTRSGTSDLYRVRRNDGYIEQLTTDPRYEAHATFVAGDRKVLFHRQTNGDNYDIIIRSLRGGREELLGATSAEEAYPAISPDGKWIAFSAVAEPNAQPNLFVMRSDGTQRRRLTTGPDKDAYAAWSPDGRSVYFVRFGELGSKIYRLPWLACFNDSVSR